MQNVVNTYESKTRIFFYDKLLQESIIFALHLPGLICRHHPTIRKMNSGQEGEIIVEYRYFKIKILLFLRDFTMP